MKAVIMAQPVATVFTRYSAIFPRKVEIYAMHAMSITPKHLPSLPVGHMQWLVP